MANWFTNQKAKRLLGDMPLTEDMTGSGGAHNQNKGYGDSDGPPMMSKGAHAHKEGHKATREPVKKTNVAGVKVKMQDNYGGSNSGNYDLLDAPGDIVKAVKSVFSSKKKEKKNTKFGG